jgi:hypothetical protein
LQFVPRWPVKAEKEDALGVLGVDEESNPNGAPSLVVFCLSTGLIEWSQETTAIG